MSFTDKLSGRAENDYHLIVTTHPYLIELGLGAMTTGSLYDWWNQHTNDGLYLNRMSINGTRSKAVLQNPPNGVERLLGLQNDTEFFWQGWKPHTSFPNTGRYLRQDLSEYPFGNGGDNPWKFGSAVGPVSVTGIIPRSIIGNHLKAIMGGTLKDGLDFLPYSTAPTRSAGSHIGDLDTLDNMAPLFDLINLNRYMASFKDYYPRSLWDKDSPPDDIAGVNKKQIFASHELLTEIKSSKIGPYVEWSGEITFNINENDGTLSCPITEWASFKLYLYDTPRSQSENNIAVKNLTYVAPKRDVTGRPFATTEDGKHTEPGGRSSYGASNIDVAYNSVTKKWESGTPQLFAKLVTDIAKPPSMPAIDRLESNTIEDDLNSDSFDDVKVIAATGTAMPIRPQNGNPHQWQPNYLKSEEARCGDGVKKETLTVYNYNTRRSYKRDEEVLLSRIDGQWHVFPLWAGTDDDGGVTSSVGKWGEFSYLMTNADYFFRADEGGSFTPREAEQSFHADYYDGDGLNEDATYGVSGGYDVLLPFKTQDIRRLTFSHGYAQQTSFDYLDSQLFGKRGQAGKLMGDTLSKDRCSISTTSALVNSAGVDIPQPYPGYHARNAAHAGVFFGCMFPEGYAGTDGYVAISNDWNVDGKSNVNTLATDYFFIKSDNRTKSPFEARDGITHRNNCRQPANVDPTGLLTGNNGLDNRWERAKGNPSASLFYAGADTNFRQIPADVMLNASPEGKNGSPIQPVHRFKNFHTGLLTGTAVQDETQLAFLKGAWLGKNSTAETVYDDSDSAFDFTPISRNHLTFRPCKMENYVQFGKTQADGYLEAIDRSQHSVQETRLGFQVEANRTQGDDFRPCSYTLEDREAGHAVGLWSSTGKGLRWGGDVANKRSYTGLHEFGYWDEVYGAMRWTRGFSTSWRGASAFGVITTFNTVSANSQIDFNTENIYGMGAGSHGKFSIATGTRQDRTWGVPSLSKSYQQENIVDLSVRVYQQHPRDQLLYDPRTFAVHHFNPNPSLNNLTTRVPKLITVKDNDEDGDPIEYEYESFISKSTVDFREVCRYDEFTDQDRGAIHQGGAVYTAVALGVNDFILSNATVNSSVINPPVCPDVFWLINIVRVGKLLPFMYHRIDVGISIPEGTEITIGQHFSILASDIKDNTPVTNLLNLMVVKNVGTDYAAGDIIGIEKKGISLRVVAPVGPKGEIKKLLCVGRGNGLLTSDSASVEDEFDATSLDVGGSLSLNTIQSDDGSGFDAYFVATQPYKRLYTDPKPYLMKKNGESEVRIAADVGRPTHQSVGKTSDVEALSFVNEPADTTFILDPTLYSENKQYDVFFHFHNDITMTWLASNQSFHGDNANVSECSEQHVTVRINPR
jgi:hypothetical protein